MSVRPPMPPMIPPSQSRPDSNTELAQAIENGLLTLAESIKYAVDTYVEFAENNKPKKSKLYDPLANVRTEDYAEWLDENGFVPVPWRKVLVGDVISPTGMGLRNNEAPLWRDKGRIAYVTAINNGVDFQDVLTGETSGGCYNEQSRFTVYERIDNI